MHAEVAVAVYIWTRKADAHFPDTVGKMINVIESGNEPH